MSSDLAAEGDPLDVHRHGTGPARFRHCSFRDPPGPVLPRLIPPLRHRAWAPVYIRRRMLLAPARLLGWPPTNRRGVKLTGWVVVPCRLTQAQLFGIGLVAAALALVAVPLTSGPMLSLTVRPGLGAWVSSGSLALGKQYFLRGGVGLLGHAMVYM